MAITVKLTTNLPDEAWEDMYSILATSPEALRPPLSRDYLLILDYLRCADNAQPEIRNRLVSFWEELGSCCGISDTQLRTELSEKRKEANGGLVGCNWVKCPLYEQECDETFSCAGCRRAMYCGLSCQKRCADKCGCRPFSWS